MAIEQRWYLICDGCIERSDDWFHSKASAEESARYGLDGFWRVEQDGDLLCDACKRRRKGQPSL